MDRAEPATRAEVEGLVDLLLAGDGSDPEPPGGDQFRIEMASVIACTGEVLASRVLGTPADIDLAHQLAMSASDDSSVEVPAWKIETLVRSFAGDDGIVAGLDHEEILDAALAAIRILLATLMLDLDGRAALKAQLVDCAVGRRSEVERSADRATGRK